MQIHYISAENIDTALRDIVRREGRKVTSVATDEHGDFVVVTEDAGNEQRSA